MSRTGAAIWVGISSALGLGLGIGISRAATAHMQDSATRANIVLGAAVAGAAIGGATASAITTPKLLTA